MATGSGEGCDIIVFPEMSLSGYNDPAKFPDSVQPLNSEWVSKFVTLPQKYHIAASAGFIETNPAGKPFITQMLAQDGQMIGSYRKRQVVDEEAELVFIGRSHTHIQAQTAQRRDQSSRSQSARTAITRHVHGCSARWRANRTTFLRPGLYGRRTDEASWQAGFDWYKSHLAERLPIYAREHGLHIAVATQTGATVDEDFPGGSFVFGPDGECLAASPDWSETMLTCDIEIPPER